jgi:hypothetical protein
MITGASDRLKAALRDSHLVLSRVTLCEYVAGEYVEVGDPLPIEKGTVGIDAGSNVWRTLNATVVVPPLGADGRDVVDLLNVESAEVKVEMGVEFAPGDQEWVQVGQLRIETLTDTLSTSRKELVAYDRAIRVADFPLVTTYAPRTMTGDVLSYIDAAKDLITAAFPSEAPPEFVVDSALDDAAVPPLEVSYDGDRWSAINELLAAVGAVAHNDHLGRFVFRSAIPDAEPVWTFDVGETGVLIDADIEQTRDGQANAVALTCEPPSGDRIFVYLVDSDPASPTYYDGPFGRKPIFRRNDTISNASQAVTAARGYLVANLGAARAIDFQSLYNFLVQPMDVVAFDFGDGVESHAIDGLSFALDGGEMSGATRVFTGVDDVS